MNCRTLVSLAALVVLLTFLLAGCSAPSTLTSIQVTPSTSAVAAVGTTVQFTAMGTYSRGKHPSETRDVSAQVTWASSTPATATINSSGLATSVGAGTTSITATTAASFGPVSGTASMTVSTGGGGGGPATRDLTAITLIPGTQVLNTGETVQFIALGTFSASPTTEILTTGVVWQSSTVSVATVSASGLATAVGCATSSCTTTITANATALSGSVITGSGSLTVNSSATPGGRDLTAISLIPATQTLNTVGETAQFIAIGTFSSSPTTQSMAGLVTWHSSDTNVATADSSGQVTAAGCATTSCVTTITATGIAKSGATIVGTATLNVNPGVPPAQRTLSAITIIPGTGTQTLNSLGETAQFIAIGTFTAAPTTKELTGTDISWQSSDVDVATINSSGLATAVNCAATGCISAITASSPFNNNGGAIIGTSNVTVNPGANGTNLRSLTVYQVGSGTGTIVSSPTGVNCSSGSGCTADFPLGTSVTLTEAPNSGSSFGNWSSNCTLTTATTCTLVINSNQTVGAIFN